MGKKALLILSILLSIIVLGCSNSETKPKLGTNVSYDKVKAYPKWVMQPSYDNGIAGVGSSKIGEFGFDLARKEAMANARADLSSQLNVKINSLFKSYKSNTGTNASYNNSLSESVIKEAIDMDLRGASLRDTWISPKNELFILMTIDNDRIVNKMNSVIDKFNDSTKLEDVKEKEEKAKAKEKLKQELDDYFNDTPIKEGENNFQAPKVEVPSTTLN